MPRDWLAFETVGVDQFRIMITAVMSKMRLEDRSWVRALQLGYRSYFGARTGWSCRMECPSIENLDRFIGSEMEFSGCSGNQFATVDSVLHIG